MDALSSNNKIALRRCLLTACRTLSDEERFNKSAQVCTHLLADATIAKSNAIALFSPLPEEVQLDTMLNLLRQNGVRLFLPRTEANFGLSFCLWDSKDILTENRWGLKQPSADKLPVDPCDLDIILIPGIAFDQRGTRLGRGGGYFDRNLPRFRPFVEIIGVCFSFQVLDLVPTDPWDVQVNKIVTENGIVPVPLLRQFIHAEKCPADT